MAHHEGLAARIRQALAHLPVVEEKKMFGSMAFLLDSKLCLAAGADSMMCRIDPSLQEEAVKRAGCHTVIMRGSPCRGYVYVEEENLRAPDEFMHWVTLALDYNKKAQRTRKKQKQNL